MLERTLCNRRSLPAESLWGLQSDLRTLQPLSSLSRMVALISHDLRHPLTAILANEEFLTQTNISEMQRNDLYEEIRSAIDRINELLSSFLGCSTAPAALPPAPGRCFVPLAGITDACRLWSGIMVLAFTRRFRTRYLNRS